MRPPIDTSPPYTFKRPSKKYATPHIQSSYTKIGVEVDFAPMHKYLRNISTNPLLRGNPHKQVYYLQMVISVLKGISSCFQSCMDGSRVPLVDLHEVMEQARYYYNSMYFFANHAFENASTQTQLTIVKLVSRSLSIKFMMVKVLRDKNRQRFHVISITIDKHLADIEDEADRELQMKRMIQLNAYRIEAVAHLLSLYALSFLKPKVCTE